ncbi:type II toxin-antitoxin system RelE/ParE family toxin [Thiococcus pfennigii]|uniref:type II toxin-antitoxin system RelE/ParE family toxin n=1 Tax=Thiococcus pfennigii TaxID=1057 RepID=UPI001905838D|nr:type II toxin-antitoxin system RelE/ParE family toxin [Thiococcus pfennigii]MBK1731506.1 plasmid stabilization protein [Thiococcus pfennigii]
MGRVYRRATARRDLVEHFVYLAEMAGQDTAERFLDSARSSFEVLAKQPMMGSQIRTHDPALAGMRKWPVRDFRGYLIFYLPRTDGISVVRVLHGSRDWWDLLGIETD